MISWQTRGFKPWLRAVAAVTCLFFTSQTIGWAEAGLTIRSGKLLTANAETNLAKVDLFSKLQIPSRVGQIKKTWKGNKDHTVIHIQDAHINEDAQRNIGRILKYLASEFGVRQVYLEGADDELATELYSSLPEKEMLRNILDYYLEQGRLSGPEYAAILDRTDLRLIGVENPELYGANREAYLKALHFRAEDEKILDQMEALLKNVARFVFSDTLRNLYTHKIEFENETESLVSYIRYLVDTAAKSEISTDTFQGMTSLLRLIELERTVSIKDAEKKFGTFLKQFKPLLSREALPKFLSLSIAVKTHKIKKSILLDFLASEYEKTQILKPSQTRALDNTYTALKPYFEILRLYDSISVELFDEITSLEGALKEKLFRNDTERRLDQILKTHLILEKMIQFRLTKPDAEFFFENRPLFETSKIVDALTPLLKQYHFSQTIPHNFSRLDADIPQIEAFYDLALQRDKAILDSTVSHVQNSAQKVSVLITGGFHTPGIERRLESEGYSYAVISPSISKKIDARKEDKLYREAIQEKPLAIEEALINMYQGASKQSSLEDPRFQLAAPLSVPTQRELPQVLSTLTQDPAIQQSDRRAIMFLSVILSQLAAIFGRGGNLNEMITALPGRIAVLLEPFLAGMQPQPSGIGDGLFETNHLVFGLVPVKRRSEVKASLRQNYFQIPASEELFVFGTTRRESRSDADSGSNEYVTVFLEFNIENLNNERGLNFLGQILNNLTQHLYEISEPVSDQVRLEIQAQITRLKTKLNELKTNQWSGVSDLSQTIRNLEFALQPNEEKRGEEEILTYDDLDLDSDQTMFDLFQTELNKFSGRLRNFSSSNQDLPDDVRQPVQNLYDLQENIQKLATALGNEGGTTKFEKIAGYVSQIIQIQRAITDLKKFPSSVMSDDEITRDLHYLLSTAENALYPGLLTIAAAFLDKQTPNLEQSQPRIATDDLKHINGNLQKISWSEANKVTISDFLTWLGQNIKSQESAEVLTPEADEADSRTVVAVLAEDKPLLETVILSARDSAKKALFGFAGFLRVSAQFMNTLVHKASMAFYAAWQSVRNGIWSYWQRAVSAWKERRSQRALQQNPEPAPAAVLEPVDTSSAESTIETMTEAEITGAKQEFKELIKNVIKQRSISNLNAALALLEKLEKAVQLGNILQKASVAGQDKNPPDLKDDLQTSRTWVLDLISGLRISETNPLSPEQARTMIGLIQKIFTSDLEKTQLALLRSDLKNHLPETPQKNHGGKFSFTLYSGFAANFASLQPFVSFAANAWKVVKILVIWGGIGAVLAGITQLFFPAAALYVFAAALFLPLGTYGLMGITERNSAIKQPGISNELIEKEIPRGLDNVFKVYEWLDKEIYKQAPTGPLLSEPSKWFGIRKVHGYIYGEKAPAMLPYTAGTNQIIAQLALETGLSENHLRTMGEQLNLPMDESEDAKTKWRFIYESRKAADKKSYIHIQMQASAGLIDELHEAFSALFHGPHRLTFITRSLWTIANAGPHLIAQFFYGYVMRAVGYEWLVQGQDHLGRKQNLEVLAAAMVATQKDNLGENYLAWKQGTFAEKIIYASALQFTSVQKSLNHLKYGNGSSSVVYRWASHWIIDPIVAPLFEFLQKRWKLAVAGAIGLGMLSMLPIPAFNLLGAIGLKSFMTTQTLPVLGIAMKAFYGAFELANFLNTLWLCFVLTAPSFIKAAWFQFIDRDLLSQTQVTELLIQNLDRTAFSLNMIRRKNALQEKGGILGRWKNLKMSRAGLLDYSTVNSFLHSDLFANKDSTHQSQILNAMTQVREYIRYDTDQQKLFFIQLVKFKQESITIQESEQPTSPAAVTPVSLVKKYLNYLPKALGLTLINLSFWSAFASSAFGMLTVNAEISALAGDHITHEAGMASYADMGLSKLTGANISFFSPLTNFVEGPTGAINWGSYLLHGAENLIFPQGHGISDFGAYAASSVLHAFGIDTQGTSLFAQGFSVSEISRFNQYAQTLYQIPSAMQAKATAESILYNIAHQSDPSARINLYHQMDAVLKEANDFLNEQALVRASEEKLQKNSEQPTYEVTPLTQSPTPSETPLPTAAIPEPTKTPEKVTPTATEATPTPTAAEASPTPTKAVPSPTPESIKESKVSELARPKLVTEESQKTNDQHQESVEYKIPVTQQEFKDQFNSYYGTLRESLKNNDKAGAVDVVKQIETWLENQIAAKSKSAEDAKAILDKIKALEHALAPPAANVQKFVMAPALFSVHSTLTATEPAEETYVSGGKVIDDLLQEIQSDIDNVTASQPQHEPSENTPEATSGIKKTTIESTNLPDVLVHYADPRNANHSVQVIKQPDGTVQIDYINIYRDKSGNAIERHRVYHLAEAEADALNLRRHQQDYDQNAPSSKNWKRAPDTIRYQEKNADGKTLRELSYSGIQYKNGTYTYTLEAGIPDQPPVESKKESVDGTRFLKAFEYGSAVKIMNAMITQSAPLKPVRADEKEPLETSETRTLPLPSVVKKDASLKIPEKPASKITGSPAFEKLEETVTPADIDLKINEFEITLTHYFTQEVTEWLQMLERQVLPHTELEEFTEDDQAAARMLLENEMALEPIRFLVARLIKELGTVNPREGSLTENRQDFYKALERVKSDLFNGENESFRALYRTILSNENVQCLEKVLNHVIKDYDFNRKSVPSTIPLEPVREPRTEIGKTPESVRFLDLTELFEMSSEIELGVPVNAKDSVRKSIKELKEKWREIQSRRPSAEDGAKLDAVIQFLDLQGMVDHMVGKQPSLGFLFKFYISNPSKDAAAAFGRALESYESNFEKKQVTARCQRTVDLAVSFIQNQQEIELFEKTKKIFEEQNIRDYAVNQKERTMDPQAVFKYDQMIEKLDDRLKKARELQNNIQRDLTLFVQPESKDVRISLDLSRITLTPSGQIDLDHFLKSVQPILDQYGIQGNQDRGIGIDQSLIESRYAKVAISEALASSREKPKLALVLNPLITLQGVMLGRFPLTMEPGSPAQTPYEHLVAEALAADARIRSLFGLWDQADEILSDLETLPKQLEKAHKVFDQSRIDLEKQIQSVSDKDIPSSFDRVEPALQTYLNAELTKEHTLLNLNRVISQARLSAAKLSDMDKMLDLKQDAYAYKTPFFEENYTNRFQNLSESDEQTEGWAKDAVRGMNPEKQALIWEEEAKNEQMIRLLLKGDVESGGIAVWLRYLPIVGGAIQPAEGEMTKALRELQETEMTYFQEREKLLKDKEKLLNDKKKSLHEIREQIRNINQAVESINQKISRHHDAKYRELERVLDKILPGMWMRSLRDIDLALKNNQNDVFKSSRSDALRQEREQILQCLKDKFTPDQIRELSKKTKGLKDFVSLDSFGLDIQVFGDVSQQVDYSAAPKISGLLGRDYSGLLLTLYHQKEDIKLRQDEADLRYLTQASFNYQTLQQIQDRIRLFQNKLLPQYKNMKNILDEEIKRLSNIDADPAATSPKSIEALRNRLAADMASLETNIANADASLESLRRAREKRARIYLRGLGYSVEPGEEEKFFGKDFARLQPYDAQIDEPELRKALASIQLPNEATADSIIAQLKDAPEPKAYTVKNIFETFPERMRTPELEKSLDQALSAFQPEHKNAEQMKAVFEQIAADKQTHETRQKKNSDPSKRFFYDTNFRFNPDAGVQRIQNHLHHAWAALQVARDAKGMPWEIVAPIISSYFKDAAFYGYIRPFDSNQTLSRRIEETEAVSNFFAAYENLKQSAAEYAAQAEIIERESRITESQLENRNIAIQQAERDAERIRAATRNSSGDTLFQNRMYESTRIMNQAQYGDLALIDALNRNMAENKKAILPGKQILEIIPQAPIEPKTLTLTDIALDAIWEKSKLHMLEQYSLDAAGKIVQLHRRYRIPWTLEAMAFIAKPGSGSGTSAGTDYPSMDMGQVTFSDPAYNTPYMPTENRPASSEGSAAAPQNSSAVPPEFNLSAGIGTRSFDPLTRIFFNKDLAIQEHAAMKLQAVFDKEMNLYRRDLEISKLEILSQAAEVKKAENDVKYWDRIFAIYEGEKGFEEGSADYVRWLRQDMVMRLETERLSLEQAELKFKALAGLPPDTVILLEPENMMRNLGPEQLPGIKDFEDWVLQRLRNHPDLRQMAQDIEIGRDRFTQTVMNRLFHHDFSFFLGYNNATNGFPLDIKGRISIPLWNEAARLDSLSTSLENEIRNRFAEEKILDKNIEGLLANQYLSYIRARDNYLLALNNVHEYTVVANQREAEYLGNQTTSYRQISIQTLGASRSDLDKAQFDLIQAYTELQKNALTIEYSLAVIRNQKDPEMPVKPLTSTLEFTPTLQNFESEINVNQLRKKVLDAKALLKGASIAGPAGSAAELIRSLPSRESLMQETKKTIQSTDTLEQKLIQNGKPPQFEVFRARYDSKLSDTDKLIQEIWKENFDVDLKSQIPGRSPQPLDPEHDDYLTLSEIHQLCRRIQDTRRLNEGELRIYLALQADMNQLGVTDRIQELIRLANEGKIENMERWGIESSRYLKPLFNPKTLIGISGPTASENDRKFYIEAAGILDTSAARLLAFSGQDPVVKQEMDKLNRMISFKNAAYDKNPGDPALKRMDKEIYEKTRSISAQIINLNREGMKKVFEKNLIFFETSLWLMIHPPVVKTPEGRKIFNAMDPLPDETKKQLAAYRTVLTENGLFGSDPREDGDYRDWLLLHQPDAFRDWERLHPGLPAVEFPDPELKFFREFFIEKYTNFLANYDIGAFNASLDRVRSDREIQTILVFLQQVFRETNFQTLTAFGGNFNHSAQLSDTLLMALLYLQLQDPDEELMLKNVTSHVEMFRELNKQIDPKDPVFKPLNLEQLLLQPDTHLLKMLCHNLGASDPQDLFSSPQFSRVKLNMVLAEASAAISGRPKGLLGNLLLVTESEFLEKHPEKKGLYDLTQNDKKEILGQVIDYVRHVTPIVTLLRDTLYPDLDFWDLKQQGIVRSWYEYLKHYDLTLPELKLILETAKEMTSQVEKLLASNNIPKLNLTDPHHAGLLFAITGYVLGYSGWDTKLASSGEDQAELNPEIELERKQWTEKPIQERIRQMNRIIHIAANMNTAIGYDILSDSTGNLTGQLFAIAREINSEDGLDSWKDYFDREGNPKNQALIDSYFTMYQKFQKNNSQPEPSVPENSTNRNFFSPHIQAQPAYQIAQIPQNQLQESNTFKAQTPSAGKSTESKSGQITEVPADIEYLNVTDHTNTFKKMSLKEQNGVWAAVMRDVLVDANKELIDENREADSDAIQEKASEILKRRIEIYNASMKVEQSIQENSAAKGKIQLNPSALAYEDKNLRILQQKDPELTAEIYYTWLKESFEMQRIAGDKIIKDLQKADKPFWMHEHESKRIVQLIDGIKNEENQTGLMNEVQNPYDVRAVIDIGIKTGKISTATGDNALDRARFEAYIRMYLQAAYQLYNFEHVNTKPKFSKRLSVSDLTARANPIMIAYDQGLNETSLHLLIEQEAHKLKLMGLFSEAFDGHEISISPYAKINFIDLLSRSFTAAGIHKTEDWFLTHRRAITPQKMEGMLARLLAMQDWGHPYLPKNDAAAVDMIYHWFDDMAFLIAANFKVYGFFPTYEALEGQLKFFRHGEDKIPELQKKTIPQMNESLIERELRTNLKFDSDFRTFNNPDDNILRDITVKYKNIFQEDLLITSETLKDEKTPLQIGWWKKQFKEIDTKVPSGWEPIDRFAAQDDFMMAMQQARMVYLRARFYGESQMPLIEKILSDEAQMTALNKFLNAYADQYIQNYSHKKIREKNAHSVEAANRTREHNENIQRLHETRQKTVQAFADQMAKGEVTYKKQLDTNTGLIDAAWKRTSESIPAIQPKSIFKGKPKPALEKMSWLEEKFKQISSDEIAQKLNPSQKKIFAAEMLREGYSADDILMLRLYLRPVVAFIVEAATSQKVDLSNLKIRGQIDQYASEILNRAGGTEKISEINEMLFHLWNVQTYQSAVRNHLKDVKKNMEQADFFQDEDALNAEINRLADRAYDQGISLDEISQWFEFAGVLWNVCEKKKPSGTEAPKSGTPAMPFERALLDADSLMKLGLAASVMETKPDSASQKEIVERITTDAFGWIFGLPSMYSPYPSEDTGSTVSEYFSLDQLSSKDTLEKYLMDKWQKDPASKENMMKATQDRITLLMNREDGLTVTDVYEFTNRFKHNWNLYQTHYVDAKSEHFQEEDLPRLSFVSPLLVLLMTDLQNPDPTKRIGLLNIFFNDLEGKDILRYDESVNNALAGVSRRLNTLFMREYFPVPDSERSIFNRNLRSPDPDRPLAKVGWSALLLAGIFFLFRLIRNMFITPIHGFNKEGDAWNNAAEQLKKEKNIMLFEKKLANARIALWMFVLDFPAFFGLGWMVLTASPWAAANSVPFVIVLLILHKFLFSNLSYSPVAMLTARWKGALWFLGLSTVIGFPVIVLTGQMTALQAFVAAAGWFIAVHPPLWFFLSAWLIVLISASSLVVRYSSLVKIDMPKSDPENPSPNGFPEFSEDEVDALDARIHDLHKKLLQLKKQAQESGVDNTKIEQDFIEYNKEKNILQKELWFHDINDYVRKPIVLQKGQTIAMWKAANPGEEVLDENGVYYQKYAKQGELFVSVSPWVPKLHEVNAGVKALGRQIIGNLLKQQRIVLLANSPDITKYFEEKNPEKRAQMPIHQVIKKIREELMPYWEVLSYTDQDAQRRMRVVKGDEIIQVFYTLGGRKPEHNLIKWSAFTGFGEDGTEGKELGQLSGGNAIVPQVLKIFGYTFLVGPKYVTESYLADSSKDKLLNERDQAKVKTAREGGTLRQLYLPFAHRNFFAGIATMDDDFIDWQTASKNEMPQITQYLPEKITQKPKVKWTLTTDGGNAVTSGSSRYFAQMHHARPDIGVCQATAGYREDKTTMHWESGNVAHLSLSPLQEADARVVMAKRAGGKYLITTEPGREMARPTQAMPFGAYYTRTLLLSGDAQREINRRIKEANDEAIKTGQGSQPLKQKTIDEWMNPGNGIPTRFNGEDEIVSMTAEDTFAIWSRMKSEWYQKKVKRYKEIQKNMELKNGFSKIACKCRLFGIWHLFLHQWWIGNRAPFSRDALDGFDEDYFLNLGTIDPPLQGINTAMMLRADGKPVVTDDRNMNIKEEEIKSEKKWRLINDLASLILRYIGNAVFLTLSGKYYDDFPVLGFFITPIFFGALTLMFITAIIPGYFGTTAVMSAMTFTLLVLTNVIAVPLLGALLNRMEAPQPVFMIKPDSSPVKKFANAVFSRLFEIFKWVFYDVVMWFAEKGVSSVSYLSRITGIWSLVEMVIKIRWFLRYGKVAPAPPASLEEQTEELSTYYMEMESFRRGTMVSGSALLIVIAKALHGTLILGGITIPWIVPGLLLGLALTASGLFSAQYKNELKSFFKDLSDNPFETTAQTIKKRFKLGETPSNKLWVPLYAILSLIGTGLLWFYSIWRTLTAFKDIKKPFGIYGFRSYITHLMMPMAVFTLVGGAMPYFMLIPYHWFMLASAILGLMFVAPVGSFLFGYIATSRPLIKSEKNRERIHKLKNDAKNQTLKHFYKGLLNKKIRIAAAMNWLYGLASMGVTGFLLSAVAQKTIFGDMFEKLLHDTFIPIVATLPVADGGGGPFGLLLQGMHPLFMFWQTMIVASAITAFVGGLFWWLVVHKILVRKMGLFRSWFPQPLSDSSEKRSEVRESAEGQEAEKPATISQEPKKVTYKPLLEAVDSSAMVREQHELNQLLVEHPLGDFVSEKILGIEALQVDDPRLFVQVITGTTDLNSKIDLFRDLLLETPVVVYLDSTTLNEDSRLQIQNSLTAEFKTPRLIMARAQSDLDLINELNLMNTKYPDLNLGGLDSNQMVQYLEDTGFVKLDVIAQRQAMVNAARIRKIVIASERPVDGVNMQYSMSWILGQFIETLRAETRVGSSA